MATIPVFLPGEFHGQRSLVGYSPWGCKELKITEQLTWKEPEAQALSQARGSAVPYQGVLGPPHKRPGGCAPHRLFWFSPAPALFHLWSERGRV